MSQTGDRHRSNFHKEKRERGERETDGGRDAETDLASAYCSSAESLHHLRTEHTAAAHRAAL